MAQVVVVEEERSRMLFCKLRQVFAQKCGCGVKENKIMRVILYRMNPLQMGRIMRNGTIYHLKRICRALFPFRLETVKVTVHEGELKGRKIISVLRKPYYSFQGIPYAKPPLGPLRFQDPQPPEPWKGVRSALREGSMASQEDIITGLTRGSEDCLFLNVFTPELPQERHKMSQEGHKKEGKAVMVWIHGGGFNLGSGNAEIYGPDFFMEEDVILVTLNYRLGVFGFLSTGTEDAPGNQGLKDIVMALKWVRQNISVFGGNPHNVTIFGESAGAAAVHLLMLSDLAKGLFQRAISQSGSALCPWAVLNDPASAAFNLGRAFGLETKDPKVLVEYLRKIPHRVLAKKQTVALSEQNKRECIPFAFLPCVEPASYPKAFLKEHPLEMLQSGKLPSDVPYITGVNEMEGIIMLRPVMDKCPSHKALDKDFERVVPRWLKLSYGSEESKKVSEKIREFYFDNKPFTKKTFKEYAELTSDTFFVVPMIETSRLHSRIARSPTFNYLFLYDGKMGLMKKLMNVKNIPVLRMTAADKVVETSTSMYNLTTQCYNQIRPAHADEIGYLFHIPLLAPSVNRKSPEMEVRNKMIKLWGNFAKFGHPTPKKHDPDVENVVWKPFSESDQHYLIINKNLSTGRFINRQRLAFWDKLKKSY